MTKNILAIIPTYNEIENIELITQAILNLPIDAHILIVDDNSPDGTGEKAKELIQKHTGRIYLLQRQGKLGLGTAYIDGFKWGIERDYQHLCEIDADFSHNPNDIPRLLSACMNGMADVAIGSRYLTGINVVNWPLGRIIISYSASLYVRLTTGMPVKDPTAGFVCYKKDALQHLLEYPIRMKGYGFQIEMKFLAYRLGYELKEIPIVFTDRKRGTSKMSGGIFSEALFGVIKMRTRAPKRIKRAKK